MLIADTLKYVSIHRWVGVREANWSFFFNTGRGGETGKRVSPKRLQQVESLEQLLMVLARFLNNPSIPLTSVHRNFRFSNSRTSLPLKGSFVGCLVAQSAHSIYWMV